MRVQPSEKSLRILGFPGLERHPQKKAKKYEGQRLKGALGGSSFGISQTCFSPKRAFQPCTLCMSFEFVIAILMDQGHFTKGMFVNPGGFKNVLFTKCRQCEMWGFGKGKGVAPGTVPARHPKSTLRKALL